MAKKNKGKRPNANKAASPAPAPKKEQEVKAAEASASEKVQEVKAETVPAIEKKQEAKVAENKANEAKTAVSTPEKKGLGKGVIAAFSLMAVAIIGLTAALIITNLKPVPVSENAPEETTVGENIETEATTAETGEESVSATVSEIVDEIITDVSEDVETETTAPPVTEITEETAVTTATTKKPDTGNTAETTKATTEKETAPVTETATKEGVTLTYSCNNSWENSGVTMQGVDFGITNYGGSLSGWKLVMEIDGLSSCDGWNGTYTVSGNTLTITNAEYNGEISTGSTVSVGCNLGTTKAFSVKSATLNGVKCNLSKGTIPTNNNNNQNNNNNNQNNNQNGSGNAAADVSELLKRSDKAKQGDDWLHTDGRRILDKNGKEVWLTGVNWFGYNTGTNTFDGLWNSQLKPSVEAIADHGFNLIRVPISAQLINQWAKGEYPRANYNNAYNPELNDMNSLQIFDYFLKLAEENGLKVMPDIHSAETDASGHNVNLWYTNNVSVEEFYSALEWLADRYKNNDTIIAIDIKNEPHGKPFEGSNAAIWNNSKDKNNWKYTAETAAARIFAKNPNVLVMVEGTEIYPIDISKNSDYKSTNEKDYYFSWWGGNLRGVKDFPINLGKYQNKLVYSPHDYGPTVYEQPWFKGNYTFDSLMKDCWGDNWFFIYKDNIAPLLIGEWGGFMREPNLKWMTYMRKLIKDNHLNHTFWCFNANSGDTGGLVLDDFKTWDETKYAFVKEVLWQENGKFVGLDHEIPLGDNGITLTKAKGLNG